MQDLVQRAVDTAVALGATYADARIVHQRQQNILVRNSALETLEETESLGIGVRVVVDGAWGFSSSHVLTPHEIDHVVAEAVRIARASARVQKQAVRLGPPVTSRGFYQTPIQEDPFAVPLEEKVALLLQADAAMRRVEGVRITLAKMAAMREHKVFANSEGALTEQVLYESGGGIQALAVGNGDVQQRSYPGLFAQQQVTGGFEHVRSLDLVGNAERIAHEAVELLHAPVAPSGTFDVIIDSTQLALQVHESCGHPIELDRVFGTEAAFAGTSFLTPDKLYTLRYGSEVVNIVADATAPLGLGTFGWDDEGVPAQRVDIVRNGRFVGYLTSRETAQHLHDLVPNAPPTSNGTMRADGWNRIPLIRMTNINLEPGTWRLEDLIADTEHGLYLEMNRSWSIDDKRLNFQFGVEVCREIKNGQLGQLYKNANYTGITPEFWNACDAVCNADHWTLWGVTNCGKGQPMQLSHVGHGAAPARFRGIRVFGTQ